VGENGVEKIHGGSVGVARQWRGVGSLVSERRCPLVRAHPQEMLVTLWSIFRRVKMVLSFRKSRVFSRTRFQLTHCSAFPTLWGVGGPAGPSEAPPGMTEKYRKKRIKNSTRRLFVPGVPFFVRNSTRPTCIHLEKKALLDLL